MQTCSGDPILPPVVPTQPLTSDCPRHNCSTPPSVQVEGVKEEGETKSGYSKEMSKVRGGGRGGTGTGGGRSNIASV